MNELVKDYEKALDLGINGHVEASALLMGNVAGRAIAALPQWRDVSKELPEEDKDVWIYDSQFETDVAYLHDGQFYVDTDTASWPRNNVTHWCYLPPAP